MITTTDPRIEHFDQEDYIVVVGPLARAKRGRAKLTTPDVVFRPDGDDAAEPRVATGLAVKPSTKISASFLQRTSLRRQTLPAGRYLVVRATGTEAELAGAAAGTAPVLPGLWAAARQALATTMKGEKVRTAIKLADGIEGFADNEVTEEVWPAEVVYRPLAATSASKENAPPAVLRGESAEVAEGDVAEVIQSLPFLHISLRRKLGHPTASHQIGFPDPVKSLLLSLPEHVLAAIFVHVDEPAALASTSLLLHGIAKQTSVRLNWFLARRQALLASKALVIWLKKVHTQARDTNSIASGRVNNSAGVTIDKNFVLERLSPNALQFSGIRLFDINFTAAVVKRYCKIPIQLAAGPTDLDPRYLEDYTEQLAHNAQLSFIKHP
ncbi:hypothetical protein DFJ73DRAFT_758165 [Zopfochytrium polystomum]|nr:hypothetical protein DFJ73DRAFT_758165 [Zopfochytrium polystomum]